MNVTTPFAGLRVAALESRHADLMADLIRKHGGEPVVAPSLREIPLEHQTDALHFADSLHKDPYDILVFMTGVGTRYLADVLDRRMPREEWVAAMGRCEVIVRGPKPLAALRELGVRVDLNVPEPNTTYELLATLDIHRSLAGARVAVQEYGKPNVEFAEGLRQRGATVTPIPVYRWDLPEDTGSLRKVAGDLIAGRIGLILFTSAQQVVHLFQIAAEEHQENELRAVLVGSVVVASVGPTTSETLMQHGVGVDIEPEHPKMGHLVLAAANRWRQVEKPIPPTAFAASSESGRIEAVPPSAPKPGPAERLHQSAFLKACRREPTEITPIWLMRQAGRYMAEYRDVRSKVSFLELCKRPELAAEVTITAANRLGVDAAILFADILLILEPLGFQLDFPKGEGPTIHNPVREPADVDRVRPLEDVSSLGFVMEAVRQIRAGLPADLPLIGFAGAPFTLACYAIEGGGSRHYERAKTFLYQYPDAWDVLMSRLTEATAAYLNAQVTAGAQALQIFDSWVGHLGPEDYRRFVFPHMSRLFASLTPDVPVIHFGTDTGGLLELQREAGGQVIGLDWRVELDQAWDRLGPAVAVQGNLDPTVLLGPRAEIERQASRILRQAAGRPGHIFNLGHGVLPQTSVDHVRVLIDYVHEVRMN